MMAYFHLEIAKIWLFYRTKLATKGSQCTSYLPMLLAITDGLPLELAFYKLMQIELTYIFVATKLDYKSYNKTDWAFALEI